MPTTLLQAPVAVAPFATDPRARCHDVDPELFYPERHTKAQSAAAKAICRPCPLRWVCLAHGVRHEPNHGIFGATDPGERRAIARRHGITFRFDDDTPPRVFSAVRHTPGRRYDPAAVFGAARTLIGGTPIAEVVVATGIGKSQIYAAARVLRYAPHLVEAVLTGDLSMVDAVDATKVAA